MTEMGWEVEPRGLEEVLMTTARLAPGVPLMVTENGSAYDDTTRAPDEYDPASTSGFSIPATCFCIAFSDSRITAGRTRRAHRSRTFFTCRRSKKE